MILACGIVSTFHPAAIPAVFKTNLEHCADAGVWEEIEEAEIVSEIVEPPHIMTSGV